MRIFSGLVQIVSEIVNPFVVIVSGVFNFFAKIVNSVAKIATSFVKTIFGIVKAVSQFCGVLKKVFEKVFKPIVFVLRLVGFILIGPFTLVGWIRNKIQGRIKLPTEAAMSRYNQAREGLVLAKEEVKQAEAALEIARKHEAACQVEVKNTLHQLAESASLTIQLASTGQLGRKLSPEEYGKLTLMITMAKPSNQAENAKPKVQPNDSKGNQTQIKSVASPLQNLGQKPQHAQPKSDSVRPLNQNIVSGIVAGVIKQNGLTGPDQITDETIANMVKRILLAHGAKMGQGLYQGSVWGQVHFNTPGWTALDQANRNRIKPILKTLDVDANSVNNEVVLALSDAIDDLFAMFSEENEAQAEALASIENTVM